MAHSTVEGKGAGAWSDQAWKLAPLWRAGGVGHGMTVLGGLAPVRAGGSLNQGGLTEPATPTYRGKGPRRGAMRPGRLAPLSRAKKLGHGAIRLGRVTPSNEARGGHGSLRLPPLGPPRATQGGAMDH